MGLLLCSPGSLFGSRSGGASPFLVTSPERVGVAAPPVCAQPLLTLGLASGEGRTSGNALSSSYSHLELPQGSVATAICDGDRGTLLLLPTSPETFGEPWLGLPLVCSAVFLCCYCSSFFVSSCVQVEKERERKRAGV